MDSKHNLALVADDHELFRAGMSALLKRDCGFTEVIEVGSLDEALQMLDQRAEVAFASFDLAMPGMCNAFSLRGVRDVFPQTRIAVVSGSGGRDDIMLALQAGVHGYVPKTLGTAEITRAIRIILSGNIYVPAMLAELPLQTCPLPPVEPSLLAEAVARLTPRQHDVLRLIRGGNSNKEIGRKLGLTENTVKAHANGLYRALGVHNRYGAAAAADTPPM
jgi:DNA-binding NarL/FixJ family response regulator